MLKLLLSVFIFSCATLLSADQGAAKPEKDSFLTRTQAKEKVQLNDFGDLILKEYPSAIPEQLQKLQCLPPPLFNFVLFLNPNVDVEKLEFDVIKNMPDRAPRGMSKPIAALDRILKAKKISIEAKPYSFNSLRQNLQNGLPVFVQSYVLLSDTNSLIDYRGFLKISF